MQEIGALHRKLHLQSLCNNIKISMLQIMYNLSQDMYGLEITLHMGPKVNTKGEFTDRQRVYRKPLYQLWDKLCVCSIIE